MDFLLSGNNETSSIGRALNGISYNCTRQIGIQAPTTEQQLALLRDFGPGMAIAGTVSTSLLAVMFLFHLYQVKKRAPPNRRRVLAWIISLPFIISFLALCSFVVPRAATFCDAFKTLYLPYLLMHLIDLAVVLKGGQSESLRQFQLESAPVTLCVPICCWFGICFRGLSYNKQKLRLIKGLIYQAPLVTLVCLILATVTRGSAAFTSEAERGLTVAFSLIGLVSFCFCTYGCNVLTSAFLLKTNWKNHWLKAKLVIYSVVLLKLQNALLSFAEVLFGPLPCIPPYISPTSLMQTIDATLAMWQAFIYGVVYLIVFRETSNIQFNDASGTSIQPKSLEEENTGSAINSPANKGEPTRFPYYINAGADLETIESKNNNKQIGY